MIQLPQQHIIKFPQGFARFLVTDRKLINKYKTNQVLKAFDFFACLKSTNTCGVISNYHSQFKSLLPICKISRSLFYTRLRECAAMGLLKVTGPDIRLISWESACRQYDFEFIEFHQIPFNLYDNKNFQYIISTIALQEQREKITKQINKEFNRNPNVEKAFDFYADNFYNDTPEYTPASLFEMQRITFAQGAPREIYDAVHKFNPDANVTVQTIKKTFGYKSHRSATYLKRNLAKRGLITITKREAVKHDYNNTDTHGSKKASKAPLYHTWYNPAEKIRTWHITDEITFNLKFTT